MRIAAALRETEQACMALIETEIEIASHSYGSPKLKPTAATMNTLLN